MSRTSWLSDPLGRINNISLSPNAKNSMLPLFEAVMNSIHAIEEKFGRDEISKGFIDIDVLRNDEEGAVGFTVRDNGVGFDQGNMESFRKSDSRKKIRFGGKGVGRLLWLKVAESVTIVSTYAEAGKTKKIKFEFVPHETDPIQNLEEGNGDDDTGTFIKISPYQPAYSFYLPNKLETIAVRTIAHFINYFVNVSSPKISVSDESETVDLFSKFSDDYERDGDYKFVVSIDDIAHDFVIHCFLVPKNYSDDERGTNGLFLGANGRAVKRFEMDQVLGLKAIDNKWAYFGYVESQLLNDTCNDTRTEFSLSDETIDLIKREAIEKAKEFLKEEIAEIRARQTEAIKQVRNEHLRFYNIAKNPDEISGKLQLSVQKEEDIFVELSRISLREYKRKRASFQQSKKKQLPDLDAKAAEFVTELKGESISALAEYVYKRKLILDVFEDKSAFDNVEEEKAHFERVVHDLICPLQTSKSELNYEDHNLWIIDDRLAFYSYFNSDKRLDQQLVDPESPRDRPDVTLFDLGMGFDRSASNEPISIIEFKRPKRDNYTLIDNPFVQVQQYVDVLRKSGEATRYDGVSLRTIEAHTPFMCQVIADITPTLRDVMRSFGGFYQRAGTSAYYKWDEGFKIFVEVNSYAEIINSARARHHAFFDKLGVT